MQNRRDLWLGIVPVSLARDPAAFTDRLDTLAWLTAADPGTPLAARLAVVHLNPDAAAARGLADAVAARDGVAAGHAVASHVGLGWLTIAAAQGDPRSADLLTAAHLRLLRGLRAANGGRDAPVLLSTIERCGQVSNATDAVRAFTRAARAGTAADAALDALIAEIDPARGLDRFLAGDPGPDPTPVPADSGMPARAGFARLMARYRLPWLDPAIDALCPPDHDPDGPTPPRPVLLVGPRDRGQADLVSALSALLAIDDIARAAADLRSPARDVGAAVEAAGGRDGPMLLRLDRPEALDRRQAACLADALRAKGFLPEPAATTMPSGARGLVMLAETAAGVPEVLRRDARVVDVAAPGSVYAAHAGELLGNAVALERGLAGAEALPLGDRAWADLRARIAGGAGPAEIRARIESI